MPILNSIKSKIYTWSEIKNQVDIWKSENKRIVFSNGCFDILHLGHVEYLSKTKDIGDILIIGLNTDESIKRIKGNDRPINNQYSRSIILASLYFVDAVVLFDEDTPINLIKLISPNFLVKGSGYNIKDIIGYDIVTENGGEVKTIELTEGYSTTNIINKIKNYI